MLVVSCLLWMLQGGCGVQVVDWILGPAERLLASHADIGASSAEAEALRRQHEQLELKCTGSYSTYAELRHRAS